eukprot:CAMPEP_0197667316 /NCGR_PEP_ID=MMETSP1338-20131121/65898_1 /TAXON_ID=43686 ORGANISM="Pelagodinium beii, Strain RCC1491" /NCGR_SAMPLE_ID=MMETSP1338 /ASSEMBLY_ACC=CAM_ASM_000754 /LENGTH=73 /DNA_ID=CAMNT_0043246527 /DNA_START=1 /DNA_END=219 /DNA_ORIENTATION=+
MEASPSKWESADEAEVSKPAQISSEGLAPDADKARQAMAEQMRELKRLLDAGQIDKAEFEKRREAIIFEHGRL